jgi:hypothetical protein
MDEDVNDEILSEVGPDRRAFVKRVVAVTAFAAPMVASYDLQSLSQSAAAAVSSNLTLPNDR